MSDGHSHIVNVLEMIARNEPLEKTLRWILQRIVSRTGCTCAAVLLYRDEALAPVACIGIDSERLASFCRRRINLTTTSTVDDYELLPLISAATEFLGVLVISRPVAGSLDPETDRFIASNQAFAALAIEHANLIDELTWKARFDALTHVGNRTVFDDHLREALGRARTSGLSVGLISVDIDRFSLFNEVLGNDVGDALLRKVARRFSAALQPPAVLTRTGGDEFHITLPGMSDPEEAAVCARLLSDTLTETFHIGDHELSLTATIGVAVSVGDLPSPSFQSSKDLESQGHSAVRHAKRYGGNRVVVFEPSMASASPELLSIEQSLRTAIRNGELLIHYQPQIHLASGRLVGAEALLRWRHPKLGLVSPASFIAVAEKAGMIGSLADWLISRAIRQHQEWIAAGVEPMRLALNISPLQFSCDDFAQTFLEKIHDFPIDPVWLDLEITETSLMENMPLARRHILQLRERGISFSLDDFGTGHSSLAYLRDLPVQALKIDREFISKISNASDRPAIVESFVSLARGLDIRTVAEGIETPTQARALRDMGCDEGQGFLFAKPLAGADMLSWALAQQDCPAAV